MPFTKGMKRPEGAGRKKGVAGKAVIRVTVGLCKDPRVRLEELGCDPLRVLAELALDPAVENGVRRLAASDLAGFVWPRKKAVEHIGSVDLNVNVSNARQALETRIAGIRERAGLTLVPRQPDERGSD
jgi:hypothetical protein